MKPILTDFFLSLLLIIDIMIANNLGGASFLNKQYLCALLMLCLGGLSYVVSPAFAQETLPVASQPTIDEKALQLRVQAEPEVALHHYNLATYWLQKRNFPEAEQAYQEALKRDPFLLAAYNNLGSLYLLQAKDSQAEHVFAQALQFWKVDAELYYNLALVLERQKKIRPAIEALQNALRFQTLSPERTHQVSGRLRALMLQYPDGHPDVHPEAQSPSSSDNTATQQHIESLLAQKKWAQARQQALQWADQAPDHALAYAYLARISEHIGSSAETVLWLRQAYALAPAGQETAYRLGRYLYWQGHFTEALTVLDGYYRLKDHRPSLLLMAEIYLKQTAFDKADQLLALARQKWPQEQSVLLAQAELYLVKKELPKAQASLDTINEGKIRASRRFAQVQGQVYLQQGQSAQAIQYLEKLYQSDPTAPIAKSLSEAYLNVGRFQEALKLSQRYDTPQAYLKLQNIVKQLPAPKKMGRY